MAVHYLEQGIAKYMCVHAKNMAMHMFLQLYDNHFNMFDNLYLNL